jgi:hypothetical protein
MPVASSDTPAAQPKPSKQQPTSPAPVPTTCLPPATASAPESVDPLDRLGFRIWLACVGLLAVLQLYQIMQYVFR